MLSRETGFLFNGCEVLKIEEAYIGILSGREEVDQSSRFELSFMR